jgi:myo-inositol-1(or 4)-monophosphatase
LPESDAADATLLVESVREAGNIARRFYGSQYKSWDKGHGNPVTEADIAIDEFLKETLLEAHPDYGWLSEETADDPARLNRERVFVVDPIDGTLGFLKQRPQFTIVAAVVEKGRPVAGAVYNPITEEMFAASTGKGATRNGEAIHVSSHTGFDHMRLLAEKKLADPARWTVPWPQSMIHETRASVAYRMALVAAGEYDAVVSLTHKSDWDIAAAELIVSEAGGITTTRDGKALRYNAEKPDHQSLICAGPALHARLLQRMGELKF